MLRHERVTGAVCAPQQRLTLSSMLKVTIMKRAELVQYLDAYLRIHEIKDYGPQGLQVEGRDEVRTIVGMVDAHLPNVEAALHARGLAVERHHFTVF